jgi:type I restriction enzyme S subunit
MRTIPLIDPQYLNTVFKELRASGYFVSIAQRAINQSSINQKNLGKTLIPIPPLAEQKRIVAKVEELMGMCDELEAQQQERELRKSVLVRSSLSRFAESPTSENLGYLFHNSYDIPPSELRKSILTLAVQGKLVSQDPEDEPASSILKATQSFFKRLVAEKKLSEPKPLPLIDDQEEPFSLPPGWEWCRLGHIIRISSGDGLIAKDMVNGPFPVFGGNGVNGYHNQNNVTKRTLVIGRVGFYCGSIHITPAKAWVTDNAFITTFNDENLDLDFLSWLLKATDLRKRDNATAQPVISGAKIYPTVLGLPPLAEQHRIVAKVDQLMALVDELERQQAASREKASNLLDAIVHEMTSGG